MDINKVCMKISSIQHTALSKESIANKIQQFYRMFVSQARKFNDEQL